MAKTVSVSAKNLVTTVTGSNSDALLFLVVILFVIWLSSTKRLTYLRKYLAMPDAMTMTNGVPPTFDASGNFAGTNPVDPNANPNFTITPIPGIPPLPRPS